jgi:hypothetical protein
MNLRRLLTSSAGHGARSHQTLSRVRTLVKEKKEKTAGLPASVCFFPLCDHCPVSAFRPGQRARTLQVGLMKRFDAALQDDYLPHHTPGTAYQEHRHYTTLRRRREVLSLSESLREVLPSTAASVSEL